MSFLRIVSTAARRAVSAAPAFRHSRLGSVRFMGGQSGGRAWAGFTPPHVAPVHKNLGLTMMTVMWLWIFYRAKEDGKAVLGLEHPWDHGSHGHSAHHHHPPAFQSTGIGGIPEAKDDSDEEEH